MGYNTLLIFIISHELEGRREVDQLVMLQGSGAITTVIGAPLALITAI